MRIRVLVAGVLVAMLVQALPHAATASPWASPGDRALRRDIELLAAHGLIDGPITTWPVPWLQISRGINRADLGQLPANVVDAIGRLKARLPKRRDYRMIGFDVDTRGTNRPRTIRDFDGGARSEADISASADYHFSSAYVRLTANVRIDGDDVKVKFDDSYIAKALGNWVFYGGTVDQWWGPGVDSALTFSTNARPMPKVGLMRLDPRPFRTKWLRWIGPWQLNIFAARQEEDRIAIPHPIVAGIRFSFHPLKGLDIGLSRTMQLCGEGRPCGFKTWGEALIGVGNLENQPGNNGPGNQLGAVDFRYTTLVGDHDLTIYGELMGEDEDNFLIDRMSALMGAGFGGSMDGVGLSWVLNAEYSDTKANRLIGKNVFRGLTYNHGIYNSGYRFHDRSLGASLDTDSRLLTIGGAVVDNRAREYWLRYRYANINSDSSPLSFVSRNEETINMVEAGTRWPTRYGMFSAELRLMDDFPDTPDQSTFKTSFEFGWQTRF